MAMTDWVMVCSSTLSARAVTHSANRRCPGRVKAQAKDWSRRLPEGPEERSLPHGASPVAVPDGSVTTHQVPLGRCPSQGATGVQWECSFSGKLLPRAVSYCHLLGGSKPSPSGDGFSVLCHPLGRDRGAPVGRSLSLVVLFGPGMTEPGD